MFMYARAGEEGDIGHPVQMSFALNAATRCRAFMCVQTLSSNIANCDPVHVSGQPTHSLQCRLVCSRVHMRGRQFVHAALMQQFSSNDRLPVCRLRARARQFSSFILMVACGC